MRSYEKESIVKNFLVFFSLLLLLAALLFWERYQSQKRDYLDKLYKSMEVCSYTLQCPRFTIDFTPKKERIPRDLIITQQTPHAFFEIDGSNDYLLRIGYPKESFTQDINRLRYTIAWRFLLVGAVLVVLALFFTLYSLRPIRNALRINDEFVKDILHDFNTPIASMVINLTMQHEEHGTTVYTRRIQKAIDTIGLLQNNLKCFIKHTPSQNDTFDLSQLLAERVAFMQHIYPEVTFHDPSSVSVKVYVNREIIVRIIDNLLSNAAKYNRPKGDVYVSLDTHRITIEDTGVGIADVKAVFQRYHKEQARGIGLGLHIVKKLCDELGIVITMRSQPGVGTTVILDIRSILRKETS